MRRSSNVARYRRRLILEPAAQVGEVAPQGREVDVASRPAVARVELAPDKPGEKGRVTEGGLKRTVAGLLGRSVAHRTDVHITR